MGTSKVSGLLVPACGNRYAITVMSHTRDRVDRLLIKTAAGQVGVGDNDGQIRGNAPSNRQGGVGNGPRRCHRHQHCPIQLTGWSHTHSLETDAT